MSVFIGYPSFMAYQTSNSYNNNIISTGTAIEGEYAYKNCF